MMDRVQRVVVVGLCLALGMGGASEAASKNRKGKPGEVDYVPLAAEASGSELSQKLLQLAELQAGQKGTWERLAVARAYATLGDVASAERLIDQVLAGKNNASDWIRIGRVWIAAGDWAKAKPWFDKVIEGNPEDEDWLAEVGSYYLLNGDRDTATRLLGQSFDEDPDNLYNTLRAALANAGKVPAP